jgi:hypothetical protein
VHCHWHREWKKSRNLYTLSPIYYSLIF